MISHPWPLISVLSWATLPLQMHFEMSSNRFDRTPFSADVSSSKACARCCQTTLCCRRSRATTAEFLWLPHPSAKAWWRGLCPPHPGERGPLHPARGRGAAAVRGAERPRAQLPPPRPCHRRGKAPRLPWIQTWDFILIIARWMRGLAHEEVLRH